jgi:LacI family transcriptional regulator
MSDQAATPPKRAITLTDVANAAGVSRATASLVMRNSPLVADETRARVLETMQTLGYVYNRNAARMRTQQSYTIGLVVPDISNPFYAELTVAVERELNESGYIALLANTSDSPSRQARFVETVLEHGVDGLLITPARATPAENLLATTKRIAVVQFIRSVPDLAVDYVGSDNVNGTFQAVAHLFERGHRRIAFIGGMPPSSALRERLEGYALAHAAAHTPIDETLIVGGAVSRSAGYNAVTALLERAHPPTAIMCYNDVVAFGAMLSLQAAGLMPGRDMAVVGYDNIADSASWHPPLTSVSGDPQHIGSAAVERLMQRINDLALPPARIILPSELIIRQSSERYFQRAEQ